MAVRTIKPYDDPDNTVLRKKAIEIKNVDGIVVQLLEDMVETMYATNGIGLAAPQIGLSKRLVVADIGDGPIKCINPKILAQEGSVWGLEGCLSIPNVYGEVERAEKVTLRYTDEKGKVIKREADGLLARVFQHEIDHLDGKLFIDKARDLREYTAEELAEIGDPERAEPAPVRGEDIMRVVFMGSDAFSVPTLKILQAKHDVALVVTQPDKPTGRGLKVAQNPVKTAALELGLPLAQPARLKDAEFVAQLQSIAPDVIVVVAYGKIIPPAVLHLPRHGCINVHGSILPDYRGAAPIERAIVNGDQAGGISTFYMNEGLDTGDVILMQAEPFGAHETGGDIRERLSHVGADLLDRTLDRILAGSAARVPQDLSAGQSTYSPTIKNDESWIDWSLPAQRIANTVRAFFPHPGTQTMYRGQVLKLKQVSLFDTAEKAAPGTLLAVVKNQGMAVACGEGAVLLQEVQPAGKKWMSAWALAQGYRPQSGEIFGGKPTPVLTP